MRRMIPAAVAVAVLAVVAGLVLDRDRDRTPVRADDGWTPILVPRTWDEPRPAPRTDGPEDEPKVELLPPATAPARIYPL